MQCLAIGINQTFKKDVTLLYSKILHKVFLISYELNKIV